MPPQLIAKTVTIMQFYVVINNLIGSLFIFTPQLVLVYQARHKEAARPVLTSVNHGNMFKAVE